MSLVSIKNELLKARQGHYAVPLYDIFEPYGVEGTLDAALAKRAPVILGIYSSFAAQPNAAAFAAYCRRRAEEVDIPVSVMLDHGASVEQCLQVISYGYTDVMYDGSSLPLEENIANTRKVVAAARGLGVMVEAELGHVGRGDEYDEYGGKRLGFTDPAAVERFVAETGVDALAVAFGNAHGHYKGEPKLDLNLLGDIRRRVDVPLVMHGGTGITPEMFQAAIQIGICKVNYATAIVHKAEENIRVVAEQEGTNMFTMLDGVRYAYRDLCSEMFDVFGTTGKAA